MTAFVYVMAPESGGPLCKVGFSINPAQRAKAVGAAIGQRVVVLAAIPCPSEKARKLEADAHCFLRMEGLGDHLEWFRASPGEALWAIYKAQRYDRHSYDAKGCLKLFRRSRRPAKETPLFAAEGHLQIYPRTFLNF